MATAQIFSYSENDQPDELNALLSSAPDKEALLTAVNSEGTARHDGVSEVMRLMDRFVPTARRDHHELAKGNRGAGTLDTLHLFRESLLKLLD